MCLLFWMYLGCVCGFGFDVRLRGGRRRRNCELRGIGLIRCGFSI